MTVQDLGSIGELIGAIATVATLAYLALQIRQSTKVAEMSAITARVDQRTHQSAIISQTPEINRLFWSGLDEPDSLSAAEFQHFESIFASFLNSHEAAFLLNENVGLSEEEWVAQEENIRWLGSKPGFRRWWATWRPLQRADFAECVERLLRETDTN
jgi:hypothetical protein